VDELRDLEMIRIRCLQVFELAKDDKTKHFKLDLKKLDSVVDYVIDVTKTNYPDLRVPYHSRWRHFEADSLCDLISLWKNHGYDALEIARRKIDMVTISVLLDAGAGSAWRYTSNKGVSVGHSEGLALATFDMFKDGLFSSDEACPHRVNSLGLTRLTPLRLQRAFQVTDANAMVGLQGRLLILQNLGKALAANPDYFGHEIARPGNVVDYVLKHSHNDGKQVSLKILWTAVIRGLESIWPENNRGVRRGDCWVYTRLLKIGFPGSDMVPFHKLSQWLTYSLLEPFEELGIHFSDLTLLTGLAEYRNGGLFVDGGVLTPRKSETLGMSFDVGSELVVEWRALTIVLLDMVAERMRQKLKKTEKELPLAAVLQGGTWAAGRKIAFEKRKPNRDPPVGVRSDGTVF